MMSWAHLPGWPRVLEAPLAAAYLSLAESTFLREVKAGRIPPPVALTEGRRGWDRAVLDAWVDRRSCAKDRGLEPAAVADGGAAEWDLACGAEGEAALP